MKVEETAVLLIEFQKEFCYEDGVLYGTVKEEMARIGTIGNAVDLVKRAREKGVILDILDSARFSSTVKSNLLSIPLPLDGRTILLFLFDTFLDELSLGEHSVSLRHSSFHRINRRRRLFLSLRHLDSRKQLDSPVRIRLHFWQSNSNMVLHHFPPLSNPHRRILHSGKKETNRWMNYGIGVRL